MLHYRTKLEITAESVEDAENDFARFPCGLGVLRDSLLVIIIDSAPDRTLLFAANEYC